MNRYICFNIRDPGPGDFGTPLGGPSGREPRATSPMPDARCPLRGGFCPLPDARCPVPSGSDFWSIFGDLGSIFGAPGPTFRDFFRTSSNERRATANEFRILHFFKKTEKVKCARSTTPANRFGRFRVREKRTASLKITSEKRSENRGKLLKNYLRDPAVRREFDVFVPGGESASKLIASARFWIPGAAPKVSPFFTGTFFGTLRALPGPKRRRYR